MSTRIGRPTVTIVLSDEERETLERWARRPTSAQALALRCRIVLAAAEGTSNTAIAASARLPSGHRRQVAPALCAVAARWATG